MPNKKKRYLCTGAIFVGSLLVPKASAQLTITVGGGESAPLSLDVTTGADFTPTQTDSDYLYLIFENIWDNTEVDGTSSFDQSTIALGGQSSGISFGATTASGFSTNDLVVGFDTISFTTGVSLTLSTGTRLSSDNLSLDYSTINSSGNVYLSLGDGTVVSNTLTYGANGGSPVPEPSSYALGLGLVALAGVASRRRRSRLPRTASV
jgi:MYXO-CTERM domain-containing protein